MKKKPSPEQIRRYIEEKSRTHLRFCHPEKSIEILNERPQNFMYLKKQTEEVCFEAVALDPQNLRYVKKQTNSVCWKAVELAWWNLATVWDQYEEICLLAVSQNGEALHMVREQTEAICRKAYETTPYSYLFVEDDDLYLELLEDFAENHLQETEEDENG